MIKQIGTEGSRVKGMEQLGGEYLLCAGADGSAKAASPSSKEPEVLEKWRLYIKDWGNGAKEPK